MSSISSEPVSARTRASLRVPPSAPTKVLDKNAAKESAAKRLERFKTTVQKTSPNIVESKAAIKKVEPKVAIKRQPLAPKNNEINKITPSRLTPSPRKFSVPEVTPTKSRLQGRTLNESKLLVIKETETNQNYIKEKERSQKLLEKCTKYENSFDLFCILIKWYEGQIDQKTAQNQQMTNQFEKSRSNFLSSLHSMSTEVDTLKESVRLVQDNLKNDSFRISTCIKDLNEAQTKRILLSNEVAQSKEDQIISLRENYESEIDQLKTKLNEIEENETAAKLLNETSKSLEPDQPDADHRKSRVMVRRNRSCAGSRRSNIQSMHFPANEEIDENTSMMSTSFYADNEISSLKAVLEMKSSELTNFRRKVMQQEEEIAELKKLINSNKNLKLQYEELRYRFELSQEEERKLREELSNREVIIANFEREKDSGSPRLITE